MVIQLFACNISCKVIKNNAEKQFFNDMQNAYYSLHSTVCIVPRV